MSVSSSNGTIIFSKKETVENVSEVRHGGYEVKKSLPIVRD